MIVELADLRVETVPVADAHGLKWKLTSLENWYSSPPVKSDITDAPQSDTAFDTDRSYRGAKTDSLEGIITARTVEDAVAFGWQRVAGIAALGERIQLKVTDPTGTYTMMCRVDGTPTVKPFTDRRARFQIPLIAADGRKYGPWIEDLSAAPAGVAAVSGLVMPLFGPVVTGRLDFGPFAPSGLIEIQNTGTAATWPIFRVRGRVNAPGFQILSEAGILEFSGPVPLGSELMLSPYSGGRATIGDVDVTGEYLTRSEWPPIGPGETRQYVFNPLGSYDSNARLFADFREAWW
ncbi:minor tail protein [Microbacterium phage ValentiniPuff]|uniref:Minor tail protein n=1 Tax=Microbacterium phage ValentiniPuff TaxID=2315705 RepID=A0A386KRZ1_9CAUD|nr:minor tail protein [Microbacterium phage ValentiniPuff]